MRNALKKGDLIVFNREKKPIVGRLSGPQYHGSYGLVTNIVEGVQGVQILVEGVLSLVDENLVEKVEHPRSEN